MAIDARSTIAPTRPLLPFTPRSAVEIRREVERQTNSAQVAPNKGEAIRSLKSEEPKSATVVDLPPPAPLPSLTSAFSRRRAIFGGHEVLWQAVEVKA